MMATGCIQALQCNTNTCPVGVATQDKSLIRGLNIEDKSTRVANFHDETLKSFAELIAATGVNSCRELTRGHINRRVSYSNVLKYDEIFPSIEIGSYLNKKSL